MAPTSSSGRLLQAVPYQTLVVIVLGVLVVAAIAIPRYSGMLTEIVTKPKVPAQMKIQRPVTAARTELPSPRGDVSSVPEGTVFNSPSIVPTTVRPHSSDNEVAKAPVARKWNGDWQAATAHLDRGPATAGPATASQARPTAAVAPVADSVSSANAETVGGSVTMGGCLEISVDGERFRLTDTEGTSVPKARNWRSGFLKKQTAAVDLLEVVDRTTARLYVGQRVTVTGVLENREMRVRSLQALGRRCE